MITWIVALLSMQDEEIYQFFSGIKELESSIEAIRVVRDAGTSMGKGIAYILFKTRVCVTVLQGIFVVYFNSYKVIELWRFCVRFHL